MIFINLYVEVVFQEEKDLILGIFKAELSATWIRVASDNRIL
jgi:hypothetical protein